MAFPAVVIAGILRQAALNFIINTLHQPASDSDETACRARGGIPSGYRSDGTLVCLPKPKPPTKIIPVQPIPKISQPPTTIYQDNSINININVNSAVYPKLPERRLHSPNLPVGGGRSDSVLKKVITVNTAIKNADYGHLLHEPITNSPVAFQVCKNGDHIEALKEKQIQAAESFFNGLFAAQGIANSSESDAQLPEPSYSMSETSVALVGTKDSSVGALFGIEGINDFISSFLDRSFLSEIPITGTIPLNYEYIDCSHNATQVNNLLENLEVINIQQYIESLGLDNVSNQLSSLSAKTRTADNLELEYLYNQIISASAKASTVAGLPESLEQEYLHNRLVSISTKVGAASTAEIDKQEYLHNQLVSISAKSGAAGTADEASSQEYLHNQVISLSVKAGATDSVEMSGQEYLHNQLVSLSVKISSTDIIKILEIIGLNDFPITVPESILSKIGDNKQQNQIATKQIKSLTQFVHWFFERFDEVTGQWEIPIEIKDTDPTTPGNQSKMLKVPNMAEALATIIELLLQISINSELDINMNTRMMIDIGQDKKQNFISYKILDAIADYLGFAFKEKEVKLPMMFTPGKTDFSEMLSECEIPVAAMELNEKYNFQADLVALKEAARIIKAVHFTKLNPKADLKQQIMDKLKGFKDLADGINGEETSDDFDEFLQAWELGYTDTTGVGDATKPYGRDFEDRPRYRRIKKVDPNDSA